MLENAASFSIRARFYQPEFLLRLWTVIRLPLLGLLILLVWPDEAIWLVTLLAIHLLGTIPERATIFLVTLAVVGGGWWLIRRLGSGLGLYLRWLGVSALFFAGLFYLLPQSNPLIAPLFLTGLLALNTLPNALLFYFLTEPPERSIINASFALLIGLPEMLLPRPWLLWLPLPWQNLTNPSRYRRVVGWLPVTLFIPALAALWPSADSLAELHRAWFPDPAVQMFARGNFSWTELDSDRRILYVSGYGTNYLQAFRLEALQQPPLISPVENGYAQGFAYNPAAQELYVYNVFTHQLLVLEADTLTLKQTIPIPPLSPGDVWLAWEPLSNTITIASEADEQVGIPTLMVDRASGRVVDSLNLDPGNIALHPTQPWLYLSFLRRLNELLIYDTQQHQIIKRAPAPERIDRLIFARGKTGLELFVSAPMQSQVIRFDAATLERQGVIPALFGGRAIAVDATRQWLLVGSLVNHRLEVIDLATGQRLDNYYLGPWLRTIVLNPATGVAYVSSHEGLFTIQYAN